jgi:hypothetical protein
MKLVGRLKRLYKNMPILSWMLPLVFLFQLSSWSLLKLSVEFSFDRYWFYSFPSPHTIVLTPDDGILFLGVLPPQYAQDIFSIDVVFWLFVLLVVCYVLRFHLIRRKVHIAISLLFTIFLFFLLAENNMFALIIVFPLIAGYKILRIENIEDSIKNNLQGESNND